MSTLPTDDERRRFEAAQAVITNAAGKAESARLSLFEASEGLKRAKRAGRPQDAHQAKIEARKATARSRTTAFTKESEAFKPYTDPRTSVPMLDDDTPFLMFPLRIETRFGTIVSDGVSKPQLWVRVYPDDCLIDSFEPLPSETEIASTQRYWASMWKARGIEAQQRGAWRSFVASHGSGRAAWLEANYRPINIAAKPNDQVVSNLVLVIPTETPIVGQEASKICDFWSAVWLADGDRIAIERATTDLRTGIGGVRAQELIDNYEPINLNDQPAMGLSRDQVVVAVEFVEFRSTATLAATAQSWTQPARSRLLPDRLVLLAWDNGGAKVIDELGNPIPWPLTVGPDPQAPDAEQIRQEDGEIVMGEDLKWLTDFDRAVQIGMGFRVDLTPVMAVQGFERLLVIGLRLSADASEGKRLLEELLEHHRDGSSGFAVLKQGTPTNNTEDESSGFTRTDEADRTFDERLHPGTSLRSSAPWNEKLDGEWLADALGIDPAILYTVGGSRNTDQLEAQAMNTALWPATLGYSLETMLHPLFDDDDVERVRWFYERFVTGRGLLPAIRIGRQPYGVLPTTVLSRLAWPEQKDLPQIPGAGNPPGFRALLSRVNKVLAVMGLDWAGMAANVSRVGGDSGDPHQVLLDIIGLHPASVEHYQRWAESLEDLYNRMRFQGWGEEFTAQLTALQYEETGMEFLARLGYSGSDIPDILKRFFLQSANLLKGPFVDDVPLSETAELQKVTGEPWNYIEWMCDAAATSIDKLREESGFTSGKTPKALLYLLLRHSLLQAYWDSSLRLGELQGVLDANAVKVARRESPFIHVQQEPQTGESRWRMLYGRSAQMTGDPALRVADYLTGAIGTEPAAERLDRMLTALDVLKNLPTARLERLFAEHLDSCTYRLDAWQQGLVNYALAVSRYKTEASVTVTKQGVFLGAFGWLEQVRPRMTQLDQVSDVPGLDASFLAAGLPPLVHDSTNGGYIHAPSLNQAVAAAVLRNGYLANATPENPGAFAVNLSSERVRLALSFLEGIRQGQSLGALLGYQFERGLHDAWAHGEVDEYIYALRKKFPLVADRHPDTASAPTDSIKNIEARNVVDGLQLVEHDKDDPSPSYPFGFTDLPDADDQSQLDAINAEVARLIDTTDAIADLKIADSVYQAVQSNYDGVAATLESSGNGQLPTEPAVINTPRSGRTVTHRVALHLKSGLNEDVTPIPGIGVTPRARAEPALNDWLTELLPEPDKVACTVQWFDPDPVTGGLKTLPVTQKNIGLQPIDLLFAASLETEQAMSELDDRILLYAHQNFVPRADCAVTIMYRTPIAGMITFFELAPLIRSLRPLLLHSRPLRPTDAVAQGKAASSMDTLVQVKPARITKVHIALTDLRDDLVTFRDALEPLHVIPSVETQAAQTTREAKIRAGLDNRLTSFAALLERASSFGLGDSGWGFILDFKHDWFASVLDVVLKLVNRFTTRLDECKARLVAYDRDEAGMTEEERFSALAAAERCVRATITIPPLTVATYRLVVGASRDTFATRLGELSNILTIVTQKIITLHAAVHTAVSGPPALALLDPEKVDLTGFDKALVTISADLLDRAKRLIKIIEEKRLTPATELITHHDSTVDPAAKARLLGEAAKKLLGEDAILIPEFKLDDDQGLAFQIAYDAGVNGDPLIYQRTVKKTPEPTDTWLYGVARVREKMHVWEQTVILTGAFGAVEPDLKPIQVPWLAGEHWLGLEHPETYVPNSDRLCYTAHFVQPFDRTKWQCGLMLDDWTEVIPAKQETTGLTFHYDRPNAEAPQALLLVTPPAFIGAWQWQDIVDAVSETLDRAKSRAVEPAHLDQTAYALFLPMTERAATLYQVSIMTNLARNNNFFEYFKEVP